MMSSSFSVEASINITGHESSEEGNHSKFKNLEKSLWLSQNIPSSQSIPSRIKTIKQMENGPGPPLTRLHHAKPAEFNHSTTQFPRSAYPSPAVMPHHPSPPPHQSQSHSSPLPSLLAGRCPISVPGRLIGRLVHESVQTRAVAESRKRTGLVARLGLAAAGAAPLVRLLFALAFGLGAASVVFNSSMSAYGWRLCEVGGEELLTVGVAGSRVGHVVLGWRCGGGGLGPWVGLG